MSRIGRYDRDAFLHAYAAFMTTPGSHNDTYAESYHRDFFANYALGIPLQQCAGSEGHDTASIGGLVGLPPVVVATFLQHGLAAVDQALLTHLRSTHRSTKLERYALLLGKMLPRLLQDPEPNVGPLACTVAESLGFPAKRVVERVNRDQLSDDQVIGGMLSSACYIEQSFPAVLYLAARYPDDFEAALVANTNAGGDNCHRGALVGALLGAALGLQAIPERWIRGLRSREELEAEIESFVGRFA
jgi:ADP-ribosylglycohydrolase